MKIRHTGLLQLFKVDDKYGEFRGLERRTDKFRNNFQGSEIIIIISIQPLG